MPRIWYSDNARDKTNGYFLLINRQLTGLLLLTYEQVDKTLVHECQNPFPVVWYKLHADILQHAVELRSAQFKCVFVGTPRHIESNLDADLRVQCCLRLAAETSSNVSET